MQVRKVAVVATGALATAAAMGSTPAFATGSDATPALVPTVLGVLDTSASQQVSDQVMRQLAEQWLTVTPEQTWVAPWEVEPPQILAIGNNSAVSTLAIQHCGGSVVAGGGLSAPIASPNTVVGDCSSANILIEDEGRGALISALNNSALVTAPIQTCGSSASNVAGIVAPIASPNTVWGDCNNGNIVIRQVEEEQPAPAPNPGYGYYTTNKKGLRHAEGQTIAPTQAPWEVEPPQILSIADNSAVSTGAIQSCGSTGVVGAGVAAPIASPNTVVGDCNNGNIKIHGGTDDALFSLLSNSAVSTAPIQTCGATAVDGLGIALPIASPNTVIGDCNNGNIKIRG